VAGGHAFTSVSVGSTACGVTAAGDVYCWGGVHYDPDPPPSAMPELVEGGVKFTSVGVGWAFACGYATDGDVWCWGSNWSGELGIPGSGSPGGVDYAATPVKVLGQQ
jgi:alpha-tubulin suppressor-like RCC1 family protein